MTKDKFIIEPHFRLQEWVAEEKGYFEDEGLDYVFQELIQSTDGAHHYKGDKVGAMQSFERGRSSDVSCACHWTVGVAASKGKGRLYADVYSVAPAGVFVPPDSPVKNARGSCRRADRRRLSVRQPLLDHPGARAVHAGRQDQSDVRRRHVVSPARPADRRQGAGVGAVQRPVLFRRATRLPQGHRHDVHDRNHGDGRSGSEDLRKFFRALRRAQRDIDLRPDLYTHYYKNEFPTRYHATMDTRRWGPGERLVFETYTKEVYEETFRGSPITASSPTPAWAPATTRMRSSRRRRSRGTCFADVQSRGASSRRAALATRGSTSSSKDFREDDGHRRASSLVMTDEGPAV